MIIQGYTTSFLRQLLEAVHDFRVDGAHVYKLALYEESAALSSSTTTYSSTGEIVASGYTAGGITLTQVDPTEDGLNVYTDFGDVSWTADITSRGGLIYNTTPNHTYTNPSVCVLDFGMDRVSVNGVFRVQFPLPTGTTAIIKLGSR